jgi:hypothetical protein
MKTNLPDGSIIKMRQRGRDELWQVTSGGTAYTGVYRHLKKGDTIHVVTWRGSELNVKRSYQLKEDCDWVSAVPPRPPDTTFADFSRGREQLHQMLNKMGLGSATELASVFGMRIFILDGHQIMFSDVTTPTVGIPGLYSWTWLKGPHATQHEVTDFAAAQAYARNVLTQYHAELAQSNRLKCIICDPPFHNVEKPTRKARS